MALASTLNIWCAGLGLDSERLGLGLSQLLILFMVIWHKKMKHKKDMKL